MVERLTLEWISSLDDLMKDAIIEKNKLGKNILRFKGAPRIGIKIIFQMLVVKFQLM